MRLKRLDSIAEIIAGQSPLSKTYNEDGLGLPFFQGKADFQDKYPKARTWCTSSKRKEALQGDILISVRAPVGSVNICDQLSIIGRGLSAIRPLEGINGEYLYYFFKSNERKIANLGTGSTFKAITQEILKKIQIPIPIKDGKPFIDDQIRIATLLNNVESLISKRKKSIEDLDELLKSTFIEMFGDPVRNEKKWVERPLENLGYIDRGVSKHRPRNAPELLGGKYPLIQTGDISNAGTYIFRYNQTYSEIGLRQSKLWPAGTLCITIAANIAKTSILTFDTCFPDSVVGFKARENSNIFYIHFLFSFFQRILEKSAPQAAQKNINLKILRKLRVPVPPLSLQNEFAVIVEKVESIKKVYHKSLTDLENLYGTLSQKAFKGKLDLSRIPLEKEAEPQQEMVEPQIQETVKTPQEEITANPTDRNQLLR